MADKNFKVKSGLQIPSLTTAGPVVTDASGNVTSSSTISIAQGGTGQTTANNALNALLPLQTGNNNYFLQTNQVSAQWSKVFYQLIKDNGSSVTPRGILNIVGATLTDNVGTDTTTLTIASGSSVLYREAFTATASQTNFITSQSFTDGYEQVFMNGVMLLRNTDYTTSGSNTIILSIGATSGDIIEVLSTINANIYTPHPHQSISSNTNLVAGYRYFVTSGSALTLTLPASPSLNDQIEIFDVSNNASVYNITVSRNGNNINANAGNFIIDTNGGWYTLVYTGSTLGWKVG